MLCAAYNKAKDVFETVCKLGTGFSDEQLAALPKRLKPYASAKKPARVRVIKEMKPDYWFEPAVVLEVKGAEITESPIHSCNWNEREKKGLALRFPRFQRWREEKSPEQATTTKEVVQMYKGK